MNEAEQKVLDIIQSGTALLEAEDNTELYDKSFLYDYKNAERELRDNLKRAADEGRKLSIGIVGAVKAGKSSFLNALLFGGEQFLPKAITPSTATLTIITYAETPKAIVHFFSKEDWDRISGLSEEYDSRLNSMYEAYCKQFEEAAQEKEKKVGKKTVIKKLTREEYEGSIFSNEYVDERAKAANELKRMARKSDILENLEKTVELDGDIIQKLNQYVDANGEYTAIVKYVEIMIDNPRLKGIEVIDTPGLCDPVVSRGQATKDFLAKCDVVLLLSACSQFMPAETINLMANSLPSAGVREVLVIGSRYDSGIMNDKGGDFLTKAKKSKNSYETQFSRNMDIINRTGRSSELTAKIAQSPRLYISSMCYVIDKKLKEKLPLDAEEKNVYEQLKKEFTGFDDSYLLAISGINDVRKKLNAIIEKKNEIIMAKDSELVNVAAMNFTKILYDIKTYVETNNIKLRNMSKEEIEEQAQKMQDALTLSRKELALLFEMTGLECQKKLISVKSIMVQEMDNYTSFKTTADTHEDFKTVRTGWLRKETVKVTETIKTASTAHVKSNLQRYSARCMQIINDEFTYLFNKEEFSRQIKEIIMKAYESGNGEYEKNDILMPVKMLLTKLTIPEVAVDSNRYLDMVNSQFAKGYAANDEIHEMNSMQVELLSKINNEYSDKLMENGNAIVKIMKQESVGFADALEKKFSGDRELLMKQMEEQEKYIQLNTSFVKAINELLTEYKGIINAV